MTLAYATEPAARAKSRGLFWALLPVGLLGASLAGLLTMATIASRDPGFAIEKGYYERAVHWDRQQAEWAENERLGYSLQLDIAETAGGGRDVVVNVEDRAGAPLRGARVSVEAFANARAAERRTLSLREQADGSYRAALGRARGGLWEFRCEVLRDHERFTHVTRVDLAPVVRP